MNEFIAIGPREQDFFFTNNFFSGSITLYGSGKNGNIAYATSKKYRINHNVFSQEQTDFINDNMINMIKKNPNVRFMSYDPNLVFLCNAEIVKRTVCLNDKVLMDTLNNKISFRKWAGDVCTVHHSKLLHGYECTYENLCNLIPNYNRYVIQMNSASGGEGTYILAEKSHAITERKIKKEEVYLVSGYEENNIPVNMHAIIYNDDILLFPASIQIMQFHEDKLLYQGADFEAINQIDENDLNTFVENVRKVCKKLQQEGYRGVTGIDAMIVDGQTYILEMNNRFQGSTMLLNLALKDAGLPSMQEFNYEAFCEDVPRRSFNSLEVPYSMFIYMANEKGEVSETHKRNFALESTLIGCYDDGLNVEWKIAPHATLERMVFRTNIVSITPEAKVALHPNINDMNTEWYDEIVQKGNKLYLKIALINHGVVISEEAKEYLMKDGGIREAVYNAVDIYLDDIVVNSAVSVKLTALSPFNIQLENDKLSLYCCNARLQTIEIQRADYIREKKTSRGATVKDICLLATDRVRIQHSRNCCFKRCEKGCDFCEVENHEIPFEMEDIFESIDYYIDSEYNFRHFLIGGRSDDACHEAKEILQILRHINERGNWPVYIMCIPPLDTKVLDQFHDAHVTEVAFNIELWDRKLARKWMPGKGAIPLERYLKMLQYATELWGRDGDVRTAFIVGLESKDSLLEGIEKVCSLGVAPILSVFRPIPGTKGENIAPPTDTELLGIYMKAKKICEKYGLALGPKCVPCQNNTLSMPSYF